MKISESLWAQLLELRDVCSSGSGGGPLLALQQDGFEFAANRTDIDVRSTVAIFSRTDAPFDNWQRRTIVEGRLTMHAAPGAEEDVVHALRLYAPLCLAPVFFPDRPFVIAHMAQTMDGRVATPTGNSKWIGCNENLVHSHRLRALVDGVLVGGTTAKLDLPSLDVRHVSGQNPKRIILSRTIDEIGMLPAVENRETLLLDTGSYDANKLTDPTELLENLHQRGIRSVLIEGGPTTIGSFLAAGRIDLLQLHTSPILFGSGKPVLSLPAIKDVDEAIRFRHAFYTAVGNGMMITGQL